MWSQIYVLQHYHNHCYLQHRCVCHDFFSQNADVFARVKRTFLCPACAIETLHQSTPWSCKQKVTVTESHSIGKVSTQMLPFIVCPFSMPLNLTMADHKLSSIYTADPLLFLPPTKINQSRTEETLQSPWIGSYYPCYYSRVRLINYLVFSVYSPPGTHLIFIWHWKATEGTMPKFMHDFLSLVPRNSGHPAPIEGYPSDRIYGITSK